MSKTTAPIPIEDGHSTGDLEESWPVFLGIKAKCTEAHIKWARGGSADSVAMWYETLKASARPTLECLIRDYNVRGRHESWRLAVVTHLASLVTFVALIAGTRHLRRERWLIEEIVDDTTFCLIRALLSDGQSFTNYDHFEHWVQGTVPQRTIDRHRSERTRHNAADALAYVNRNVTSPTPDEECRHQEVLVEVEPLLVQNKPDREVRDAFNRLI
ncbi:MAG TPA: hypothetical protein VHR66_10830 [Gemmataceae bacterium]|jgi:DNA-directed RNA polymerase specialized sigma24 family protein|nr:hypothetical protein [Gemmataceae bacterium]